MNFLGPIGITVALVWVFGWLLGRFQKSAPEVEGANGVTPNRFLSRLASGIDYRLILAGALLPDLIDKPLVFLVGPGFVNSSLRSVGHSVVGGLLLLTIAWVVTRRWQRAATGGFGVALVAHLLMDRMWRMPEVLFWPVLGFVLPAGDVPFSHWYRVHFSQLPTTPPDFIGIGILVVFAGHMIWNRSLTRFLSTGRLS